MRVIIAGAGTLGLRVLRDLSEAGDHEVVVVEADEDRAEHLADDVDALVIHGDAADPDILEQAQIHEADALVAATGSDAINTVIAMLGHRMQVERIVVKLTSNALRGALEEIGVTDIVAPTMAAAARIEAALHGEEAGDRSQLIPGRLQIAEVTVGPGTGGRAIGDLDVPDGALIVAHVHGEESSVARPDITLEEGDAVVAIAETEKALERCRSILEER